VSHLGSLLLFMKPVYWLIIYCYHSWIYHTYCHSLWAFTYCNSCTIERSSI